MEEKIKDLFRKYAPFYHVTSREFAVKIDKNGLVPQPYPAHFYYKGEINKKDQICFSPKHDLENQKANILDKYQDGSVVYELDVEVLLSKNIGFDYTIDGIGFLEGLNSELDKFQFALETLKTIVCFETIPRNQLKRVEKKTKEEIAFEQLVAAIELYNKGQYIASITLSAAAEELFEVFLKQHSDEIGTPIPSKAELDNDLFSFTKETHGIRNYFSYRNRIKNELKHHGEDNNKDILVGDFRQVALNHISGAIINIKMRTGELPKNPTVLEFCRKEGIS